MSEIQINRATWDLWMTRDTQTDHFKDLERYFTTGSSLRSIELAELGDVQGKTLLHLLCNMGSDTLSWAKRGARVTGVDLSAVATAKAREAAQQSGVEARFLTADIYTLPDHLPEQFDIVFMSYGVLWWFPDLPRWATLAASYVKPGGILYLVDMHPVTNCLHISGASPVQATQIHPYVHPAVPLQVLKGEPDSPVRTWTYGLGEVVTALLNAGLQLHFLHEHFVQFYQQFAVLIQDEQGWWRWQNDLPENNGLPLLFSIRAEKPEFGN
jgi:SAM-dependent methyltransferase